MVKRLNKPFGGPDRFPALLSTHNSFLLYVCIFFFWYSGGLDSSLITALVVECAKEMELSYPIQTYSVGMEGSPDLKAARVVIISIKTLKN